MQKNRSRISDESLPFRLRKGRPEMERTIFRVKRENRRESLQEAIQWIHWQPMREPRLDEDSRWIQWPGESKRERERRHSVSTIITRIWLLWLLISLLGSQLDTGEWRTVQTTTPDSALSAWHLRTAMAYQCESIRRSECASRTTNLVRATIAGPQLTKRI